MAYKIFISHSTKDGDLVQDLAQRLEQGGGIAIRGSSLKGNLRARAKKISSPDDRIVKQVERGLLESDEVIVLLTDHSVNSSRVMSEAGAAFGLHKRVTPVLVGSPEIPPVLRKIKSVKYSNLPKYISELRRRSAETERNSNPARTSTKGVRHVRAIASR